MDVRFFVNSILLGVGLAVDAFSVSCANALREPKMRFVRMSFIAGVYGIFQFLMPIIGWTCVHTIKERFVSFQPFIPWIAFVLLLWIGGKMLLDGIRDLRKKPDREIAPGGKKPDALTIPILLMQGIATSIDALSVGFAIADYTLPIAVVSCLIIGLVTWIICMAGLSIGKKAGTLLTGKADILGGSILIIIGIANVLL